MNLTWCDQSWRVCRSTISGHGWNMKTLTVCGVLDQVDITHDERVSSNRSLNWRRNTTKTVKRKSVHINCVNECVGHERRLEAWNRSLVHRQPFPKQHLPNLTIGERCPPFSHPTRNMSVESVPAWIVFVFVKVPLHMSPEGVRLHPTPVKEGDLRLSISTMQSP